MFIGHYGAALAWRAYDLKGPGLGVLFVAAQAVDYGFFGLMLAGVERASHDHSIEGLMQINLEYMPFTHSLLPATVMWSLIAACLACVLAPRGRKAAFALGAGLVTASHWFLDLPVHRPDLGLWLDSHKVGFGLWNNPPVAIGLELSVFAVAFALYVRSVKAKRQTINWQVWLLAGVLLGAQIFNWLAPAPQGLLAMAVPPLLAYTLFAGLAHWADQQRRSIPLN